MDNTPSLSLVVPCYNPLEGWEKNLISCFRAFKDSLQHNVQLILVNDGSVTGVQQHHIDAIAKAIPNFKYHSYQKNRGKGYALREGIKLCSTDLALITDIDFPYENESMVKLTRVLKNEGGLVLGHRKRDYYQKVPFFRRLLSVSFRLTLKSLLHLNVDDTQCGLKGVDTAAKEIFLKTDVNGYLYDLQLVTQAHKKDVIINRVEVRLKSGIHFTNMKMSVLLKELGNFIKIIRST